MPDTDTDTPKWYSWLFFALAALALSLWLFSTGEVVFKIVFWIFFGLAGLVALVVRSSSTLATFGMAAAWFIWNWTPWNLTWVKANTYGWLDFVAPALCVVLALGAGFMLTLIRKNKTTYVV